MNSRRLVPVLLFIAALPLLGGLSAGTQYCAATFRCQPTLEEALVVHGTSDDFGKASGPFSAHRHLSFQRALSHATLAQGGPLPGRHRRESFSRQHAVLASPTPIQW